MSSAPRAIVDFPAQPRRVFRRPDAVLRADALAEVRRVIREAERAALAGSWVVGFVCYEAAPAFDAALRVRGSGRMPLAWFGVFANSREGNDAEGMEEQPAVPETPDWRIASDAASFESTVQRIRQEIAAGRTYQVNLTVRFAASLQGDPIALYDALRRAQGTGYHACIDTGDFVVLSASPELFFERRTGRIRTRPMKGTRPRGRWPDEDEFLGRELADSEKDRAENLMIVDLLRNDVGRIAQVGTVEVTSMFDVERYRTVHQMTSTIEARLRPDIGLADVFAALFPSGSVTGAPKISTMQLIAELESAPREVYCGAVGVIEPGGHATFNVPIRTVWYERATRAAVYGAGAGITFDSSAPAEYAETLAKAAVLTETWPEFELLETMRAERGVIVRLERHLARLVDSARYFGVAVHEPAIRAALGAVAAEAGDAVRVRLLVDARGAARAEMLPLEPVTAPVVALAREPVSSGDRFLFHKTTNRREYDRHRSAQPGCWDVLLWNERAEVTEFTRGNVVVELDGELWTPPRTAGLLAGTLRAELLENGTLRERLIRVQDLSRATRIWFINSLRGQLQVALQ